MTVRLFWISKINATVTHWRVIYWQTVGAYLSRKDELYIDYHIRNNLFNMASDIIVDTLRMRDLTWR